MNMISLLATTESTGSATVAEPATFIGYLPILIILALLFLIVKYRKKLLQYCKLNYKLIFGIVSAAIGGALTIYGAVQRDTMEYKIATAFGFEEAKSIDTMFYIGIAVLIVGAVLIIAHIMKRYIK